MDFYDAVLHLYSQSKGVVFLLAATAFGRVFINPCKPTTSPARADNKHVISSIGMCDTIFVLAPSWEDAWAFLCASEVSESWGVSDTVSEILAGGNRKASTTSLDGTGISSLRDVPHFNSSQVFTLHRSKTCMRPRVESHTVHSSSNNAADRAPQTNKRATTDPGDPPTISTSTKRSLSAHKLSTFTSIDLRHHHSIDLEQCNLEPELGYGSNQKHIVLIVSFSGQVEISAHNLMLPIIHFLRAVRLHSSDHVSLTTRIPYVVHAIGPYVVHAIGPCESHYMNTICCACNTATSVACVS